jgi:hypothetical protein
MKQRRRVNGTDVTQPVPPRSGLVQLLSEPFRARRCWPPLPNSSTRVGKIWLLNYIGTYMKGELRDCGSGNSSRWVALCSYEVLVEVIQRSECLDIPALPTVYHSALLAGLLFRYSVYSYTGV